MAPARTRQPKNSLLVPKLLQFEEWVGVPAGLVKGGETALLTLRGIEGSHRHTRTA